MRDLVEQPASAGAAGEIVRAHFAGRPALITEASLDALVARADAGEDAPPPPAPFASRFVGARDRESRYNVTDDGICIIPVHGVLLDRGAWLGTYWGYTTYEGLAEQVKRAAADPEIGHILLDIDSGGGMVAGLYDLIEVIRGARLAKPVTALANSMACSAAYAIGCAADTFLVNRQGMAGSIGVVMLHMSLAGAMSKAGVKTTYIKSGALKTLGNRYEDLSDAHRERLQAGCDAAARDFFAHVSRSRGLTIDYVQSLEAGVFTGDAAVAAGLADGVASFEELLAFLRSTPARLAQSPYRGHHMHMATVPGAQGAVGAYNTPAMQAMIAEAAANLRASLAQTQAPAQTSATPADDRISRAEAQALAQQTATAAVASAMTRVKTILTSEHATGREASAQALALDPSLSAETALTILQTIPKASAPAPAAPAPQQPQSALQAEMARRGNAAGVQPESDKGKGGYDLTAASLALVEKMSKAKG